VSDTTFTAGFVEASRFLVSAVGAVPGDRWDGPGLGGWSLRELVAHANRGQTLVGEYLLRPRPPEPPESDYFTEEAVAARAATPSSRWVPIPRPPSRPASTAVVALQERTSGGGDREPGRQHAARTVPAARTTELTIHALDIAHALGEDGTAPPPAPQESLAFVA
jgi:uncharacterized protein (TIGR03083 family)